MLVLLITDRVEPRRPTYLIDIDDPNMTKSKTEKEEPKRVIP